MATKVIGQSFSAELGLEGLSLKSAADGLFVAGSRALLYSQVAVELLRRELFRQVGEDLARAILAQAARDAGFNDAQLLLQQRSFERPESMLEAQYNVLAASGFGQFEVVDLSVRPEAREIYARTRCVGSPEAESHRRLFGTATLPACCHLVGYSSGWSSAVMGLQVLTIETHCVAKGDDHCELETMPYTDFVGQEAAFWRRSFESTSSSVAQELKEKLATIERQMATITAQQRDIATLSAPLLQISDEVIVLPVIGTVDTERATAMTEKLLADVVRRRASGVIIDVTGVAAIDTTTASHLLRMTRSIRLLGARVVLTGISPTMSRLLVDQQIELVDVPTLRTLQDGVRYLEFIRARERFPLARRAP